MQAQTAGKVVDADMHDMCLIAAGCIARTLALALLKAMSTAVLFSLPPSRPLSRHSLAKLAPSIPAYISKHEHTTW